ncbi:MAG: trypsin-like serine protease [Dysgonamonadaceae bacterium]|nr:trypsin-like serine protease [Dysgonamonadaceae bacterium]
MPPSFRYSPALASSPETYRLDFKEDIQRLLEEDTEDVKQGMPLRIAVGTEVNLSLNRQTVSRTVLSSSEQVWHYAIRSEGAKGLIVTFDELYIPAGGELYVYTKDREQINVFTAETNPSGGAYATDALAGDEIIFEYVPASPSENQARIHISNIAYIYKSMDELLADDLSCYINTNCSEADNWQLQKKGVVRLLIPRSALEWVTCTGSLINNVREDGTPYVLTANHCVSGDNDEVFSTLKFEFFKETTSTNCHIQTGGSSSTKTLTGGTLLASTPIKGSSDGTLLKINTPIPEAWEVYYNGWDARGIAATSGVSIHHPNGYVKKISTFETPLVSVGNIHIDGGLHTGANAHWEVVWAATENGFSVTYGGSSGSPIFNQDGLIVGTLTGGSSFCDSPENPDYYGKFSYHWDKHPDAQQHFKQYLDPDSVGALWLRGYNPHGIVAEDEPVATEATEITSTGFTAHWNAFPGAILYLLSVYQKTEANDSVEIAEYKVVGAISKSISGLKENSDYYYSLVGFDGEKYSRPSNEIAVKTDVAFTATNPPRNENKTTIYVDGESLYIRSEVLSDVFVYNAVGRIVAKNSSLRPDTRISLEGLPEGVYLVRTGNEIFKIRK